MGFKVEAFHLGLPAYRQGSITFAMLVGGALTAWTLSARAVEALPGDGSPLRRFNLNREIIEAAAAQIAANLETIPDRPTVIPEALLPSTSAPRVTASSSVE